MINAIVTDIEGTTTSVSFVYDVLFPYAREHICTYLQQHRDETEIKRQLAEINREAGKDLSLEQACAQLLMWMDEDRKITPLKMIQGLIWDEGYRNGGFTGHVYPDVPHMLEEWKRTGIMLYVYSSGSIRAQKLLFAHTRFGDLTGYFSGYFDTTTGNKRDAESYRQIAAAINSDPGTILFLSDVPEELAAANEAGLDTALVDREGKLPLSNYKKVESFDEIIL